MISIIRYKLTSFANFDVSVEIDNAVLTEAVLTELTEFWSGVDVGRFGRLNAFLGLLYRRLWWVQAESGNLNVVGLIKHFSWADGRGVEGFPPLDGTQGIRLVDCDTVEFDENPHVEVFPTINRETS